MCTAVTVGFHLFEVKFTYALQFNCPYVDKKLKKIDSVKNEMKNESWAIH